MNKTKSGRKSLAASTHTAFFEKGNGMLKQTFSMSEVETTCDKEGEEKEKEEKKWRCRKKKQRRKGASLPGPLVKHNYH